MSRGVLAAIATVLVVIGVAVSGNDGPSSDLIPAHRALVDRLASERDCVGLQDTFDRAYDRRGQPGSVVGDPFMFC